MNDTEAMARTGILLRRDGTSTPVRLIPTGDSTVVFRVVDKDGDRVRLHRGDALKADAGGPSPPVVAIDGVNTWAQS